MCHSRVRRRRGQKAAERCTLHSPNVLKDVTRSPRCVADAWAVNAPPDTTPLGFDRVHALRAWAPRLDAVT